VIDEAAAIPLPLVKAMLGPYLVFLCSTVNGYEGTGEWRGSVWVSGGLKGYELRGQHAISSKMSCSALSVCTCLCVHTLSIHTYLVPSQAAASPSN
jgi:hypothetical protein